MSEPRFILCQDDFGNYEIRYDDEVFHFLWEVAPILNEQQATIEEYKDFCLNLCKFLIQKRLVEEYREKYGKEYKIITKWGIR